MTRWFVVACALGVVLAPAVHAVVYDAAPCFHRVYPIQQRVGGVLPPGTTCVHPAMAKSIGETIGALLR